MARDMIGVKPCGTSSPNASVPRGAVEAENSGQDAIDEPETEPVWRHFSMTGLVISRNGESMNGRARLTASC